MQNLSRKGIPYLNPQFRIQGDYFGINLGLFLNVEVFSRDHFIPPLLPSIGFKAGLLHALYLSADYLNDFLFGPSSIGINVKIAQPGIYLWIGNTVFSKQSSAPGLRLEVLIADKYLLKAQGVYNFEEQDKQYGFRVGMRYVLDTR